MRAAILDGAVIVTFEKWPGRNEGVSFVLENVWRSAVS